jgi:hypothetical protein
MAAAASRNEHSVAHRQPVHVLEPAGRLTAHAEMRALSAHTYALTGILTHGSANLAVVCGQYLVQEMPRRAVLHELAAQ